MEATKATPLATYSSLKRLFHNATAYWAMYCTRVARDKYGSWVYYGRLEKTDNYDRRELWYRVDVDSQELKAMRRYSDYLTPTTVIYMSETTNRNTGEQGFLYSHPYIKSRGKNKGKPNYAYEPPVYGKSNNRIMAD